MGLWPSYFSKFFNGTANFTFYFHSHASMVAIWVLILIIQPIRIQKKKIQLHRLIGKISYLAYPLIIISIMLLSYKRQNRFGDA